MVQYAPPSDLSLSLSLSLSSLLSLSPLPSVTRAHAHVHALHVKNFAVAVAPAARGCACRLDTRRGQGTSGAARQADGAVRGTAGMRAWARCHTAFWLGR
eukprot:scaffold63612_cov32-Tisochrysis_lutea.AAC.4